MSVFNRANNRVRRHISERSLNADIRRVTLIQDKAIGDQFRFNMEMPDTIEEAKTPCLVEFFF